MKRGTVLILIVLIASAIGAGWWWLAHRSVTVSWQGYAEADFVKVGPTQSGLLTTVRVARGDHVTVGLPLFDQDDVAEHAGKEQAQRQCDQATRQLANLQAPGRTTEIQQAESMLADAQATRERTKADLARIETLVPSGAATVQTRDQIRNEYLSAVAKEHGSEAALAQIRLSIGRPNEISAQMALIDATRATAAMADWRLAQRHVASPCTGVVADVMARPGETIAAGTPVVSLLPPGNIFVRFFVSEAMLSQIHLGDRVSLTCDTLTGDPLVLPGTVDFIAPQAEYTPPLIYSDTSRAKLVFMVQARPDRDNATRFNPGQPVTVRCLSAGHAP